MRISKLHSHRRRTIVGGLLAAFALSSCSGGSSPMGGAFANWPAGASHPAALGGFMSPAAKKSRKLLYIASYADSAVEIYSQKGHNQAPIGQLTAGVANPTGLAVARNGDLYVSNYKDDTVSVFHKGATTPYQTLSVPDATNIGANDVAIDSLGNVYVGSQSNVIEIYSNGSSSPTSTLTDTHVSVLFSVGVDSSGDVFDMGYNASGATSVDEFSQGSSNATVLPISVTTGAYYGGLALDAHNDLYVGDFSAQTVSEYAPPYTSSALHTLQNDGGTYGIVLNRKDKDAWLAGASINMGLEYSWPKRKLVDSTANQDLDLPWGIAVSPPGGI